MGYTRSDTRDHSFHLRRPRSRPFHRGGIGEGRAEGSSGTPQLSANKPARAPGQQGQKPPSHGTWQGAPEDGRLGGTLERRRKEPGRRTSPTDAGLTATTSFLLALDDGAYDVPGEGGLRHEPLFTAPTASGETSTTVSKTCSAAPRATLVTSRRPGPRPPRPWIRRPGAACSASTPTSCCPEGSPDGIRDYAEGCAGDLAGILQRAQHDVGHRGAASVHDVPRPLDNDYDPVLGLFQGAVRHGRRPP